MPILVGIIVILWDIKGENRILCSIRKMRRWYRIKPLVDLQNPPLCMICPPRELRTYSYPNTITFLEIFPHLVIRPEDRSPLIFRGGCGDGIFVAKPDGFHIHPPFFLNFPASSVAFGRQYCYFKPTPATTCRVTAPALVSWVCEEPQSGQSWSVSGP